MRYEKKDGATHIYVDEKEKEYEVLFSIVRASFALARPVEEGWKLFDIAVNMGIGRALEFLKGLKHPDTPQGVLELMDMQVKRYAAIVAASPSQAKFIKGWVARGLDRGEELV